MLFHKFQGLGNDFLIVRESELKTVSNDWEAYALSICDRRFGVGADGLEVILDKISAPDVDFEIRLFNSDGGETAISGNGTRCVGAYLYLIEKWDKPQLRIATGAGVKTLKPVERYADGVLFETDMGKPRYTSEEIPVKLSPPLDKVIGQQIQVNGRDLKFTSVSMGNPHCSIFVDDFDSLDWRALGTQIEIHQAFPERTNVEFIKVLNRKEIEVRFWERGCGETLASGTGSCAASLASMLNNFTDRKITVNTEAGSLIVEWLDDETVMQTAEARYVFKGDF